MFYNQDKCLSFITLLELQQLLENMLNPQLLEFIFNIDITWERIPNYLYKTNHTVQKKLEYLITFM